MTKDTGPRIIGFKLTNSSGGLMFRYGATTLQTNTWYHIAGVYDAASQSLHVYLNGQLNDGALQGTVTATQQNSTANVNIGRRAGATGYEFAGRVDDVRIYNRALNAAEVQADMLTPVGTIGSTDPNPPDVHLEQPAEGALVTDIVVVEAHASDDVGIAGVQFFVDGVLTGSLDTVDPFALTWDTRSVSNGAHTLTARAYDTSGNSAVSPPVTVNVSNANYFQNEILATGLDFHRHQIPSRRPHAARGARGKDRVLPAPYTQPDPTPFLQLTNVGSAGVQQGIYDIALDPNFATNHYYYVFYTSDTPNRDRLSRFTANGTLDRHDRRKRASPLSRIPDRQHRASRRRDQLRQRWQDLLHDRRALHRRQLRRTSTNPRGKIHRINPDGTVPTDNPFYDGAGPNWDSIWAYGLRNPVSRLLRRADRPALHRRRGR